jgi:anthranilate phosphoribosyltransferase
VVAYRAASQGNDQDIMKSFQLAVEQVSSAIDSGAAAAKLESWVAASQS